MENKSDRITVKEASELLGMSEQGVREHMKRDMFNPPIGHVTQINKTRRQYQIYRSLVNKYLEMEEPGPKSETESKSREEIIGELVIELVKQILKAISEDN